MTAEPKAIVIDFDDTIATPDYPNVKDVKPGAREALQAFRDMGFQIIVSSCRACAWNWECYYGDDPFVHATERPVFQAMKACLDENNIPYDILDDGTKGKPSGRFYVDDKAVTYKDNWPEIVQYVRGIETGRLPEKNCDTCNYPLDQHGTGLGIPNAYIPCEYCWLKDKCATLEAELAELRSEEEGK